MTKEVICFYHGDMDGIAAAAIVNLKYPEAKFVRINYDSAVEKFSKIKFEESKEYLIIIVDFSFDINIMSDIIKHYEVIWCDHHKSAKEKLLRFWKNMAVPGIRQLDYSGCELTWMHFFPRIETPDVIKLIGDRDLWKFEYDGTKPFNERIHSVSNNPTDAIWILLLSNDKFVPNLIKQIIAEGKILLEDKNRRVRKAFNNGLNMRFKNYKTKIINSGSDISEIGHYTVDQGYEIGLIWRQVKDKFVCSLRSQKNIDVSAIAKEFGGGGHKNAAGISFESYDEMAKEIFII